MTGFSDLPNELVVEVWRLLRDPEDIEAFALTSKRFYALGSDAIAAHNELRSRFWSIRHDPDDLTSTPADTLRSLLLNPRAALYVRNLTIDGWRKDRRRRPNRPDVPDGGIPYPDEDRELINQAISQSPFKDEDRAWDWVKFDKGDEEYIYCLIMTLLTHVQQLNLFRFSSDGVRFSETIQNIACSNSVEALSRLTKVTVCQEHDNAPSGDIDRLHYATTIPSVKVIEARGIGRERDVCNCPESHCCEDCWKSFDDHDYWCHATNISIYKSKKRSSAATHLTLSNCQLNSWRLSKFLGRLRKLESFTYSARMEPSYIQPQTLVDTLLKYGKESLQTLHLRSIERVADRQVVLADFKVMTELDIEYNLLIDDRAASPRTKLADTLP
ncbi:MAG: hypothetical protein Q9161_003149 [Pseudevernia consocians]